jgi:hypothetical protein
MRFGVSAASGLSQAMPIKCDGEPAANRGPLPNRFVSFGTATATAKLTSVIGRKAMPA